MITLYEVEQFYNKSEKTRKLRKCFSILCFLFFVIWHDIFMLRLSCFCCLNIWKNMVFVTFPHSESITINQRNSFECTNSHEKIFSRQKIKHETNNCLGKPLRTPFECFQEASSTSKIRILEIGEIFCSTSEKNRKKKKKKFRYIIHSLVLRFLGEKSSLECPWL